jgi:hypothetical protein
MTIRTLHTEISTAHILPKYFSACFFFAEKEIKKYPGNRQTDSKKQKNGGKKYK